LKIAKSINERWIRIGKENPNDEVLADLVKDENYKKSHVYMSIT
jgi:hypothetical protein